MCLFPRNLLPAEYIKRNRLADNEISTEEASAIPRFCEGRAVFPVSQGAANLTPIDTMSHAVSAPLNSSNPVAISTSSDYIGYPMLSMPYTQGPEVISSRYALVPSCEGEERHPLHRVLPVYQQHYLTIRRGPNISIRLLPVLEIMPLRLLLLHPPSRDVYSFRYLVNIG